MITIEENSEAFRHLAQVFRHPSTYKVSLAIREDVDQISVKANEGMWTAPLSTVACHHLNLQIGVGNSRLCLDCHRTFN